MEFMETFQREIFQQLEIVLRLLTASLMGIGIGFERKNRNKVAGVRTHAVVAFGSALIMIVSKYGFADVGDFDASRMAAQIVSGIGFLGAGIIWVKNNTFVSGLTTAAGLWATAGVGMCAGTGMYFLTIASTGILILLQECTHRIRFLSKESIRASIKVIMKDSEEQKNNIQNLQSYILQEAAEIEMIQVNRAEKGDTKLDITLIFPEDYDKVGFINRLAEYPGVISVKG